ncbi:MAG: hypothetical protein HYW57_04110 [Ignavibacteriales bacterium]|nr:hypothetical protein [Ignavibacteriales bacterium]
MSGKFTRRVILAAAVSIAGSVLSVAQERDTSYSLTVFAGGGYTRNLSGFDTPLPGLKRNGIGGTVRVMWRPEHLLRVGLETGVTQVYSVQTKDVGTTEFGTTNFSSFLNVIPLALVFAMPLTTQLEGHIGSTSYLLFSRTESFGHKVTGFMLSIGFSAALTYIRPIGEDWGVGAELKWYHIEKSKDDNVMLHVIFSYRFLEW